MSEEDTKEITSPERLAHIVFRTSNFEEMVSWYLKVLGAKIVFKNEILAFIAYDDEHHRVAFVNMPDLGPQGDAARGFHHAAFTYGSLRELLETFDRLRKEGIEPIFPINHGPTTSIYYADPDGNQIELQIDNYDDIEDATAFFYSDQFADNPIGVEFDPAELLERLNAGEPEENLKYRPDVGKRGLEHVKLR